MDSKELLLQDWTTVEERKASAKISIIKLEKDDKTKTIVGKLAKGQGENYNPSINWKTGDILCACGTAGRKGMLFCKHLIALFDTLCSKKRTEKFADMFLRVAKKRKDYKAYRVTSERLSTGCDLIDKLLDGGFPKSIVTFVAGPTKVGKTWLMSQVMFYNALLGKKVLYIDTERYYIDEKVFPRMAGYFKERFKDLNPDKDPGDVELNVDFLFPKNIKELASYFGLAMNMAKRYGKPTPTIFSNVGRDVAPIYGICKSNKVDLVIIDSLTAAFKKGVISSQMQSLPGRGDMLNAFYAQLEEIADDLGVAIIMSGHASRSFDFKVDELLVGKAEKGLGVWGGYSLMHNIKYLVQMEYIPTDDKENEIYRGRASRYIIRRLWPALYPRYVIVEHLRDYGFEDFNKEI